MKIGEGGRRHSDVIIPKKVGMPLASGVVLGGAVNGLGVGAGEKWASSGKCGHIGRAVRAIGVPDVPKPPSV